MSNLPLKEESQESYNVQEFETKPSVLEINAREEETFTQATLEEVNELTLETQSQHHVTNGNAEIPFNSCENAENVVGFLNNEDNTAETNEASKTPCEYKEFFEELPRSAQSSPRDITPEISMTNPKVTSSSMIENDLIEKGEMIECPSESVTDASLQVIGEDVNQDEFKTEDGDFGFSSIDGEKMMYKDSDLSTDLLGSEDGDNIRNSFSIQPRNVLLSPLTNSYETIQVQMQQFEELMEQKMNKLKDELLKEMTQKPTITQMKQETIRVELSPINRFNSKNQDRHNSRKGFDYSPRGVHISSKIYPVNEEKKEKKDIDDENSSISSSDSEEMTPEMKEEKTKFEAIFEDAISNCFARMRDILGLNQQDDNSWKYSEEAKWLRELYSYLKEENIHLRDILTVREAQIALQQKTLQNLTKENKEAFRTIQELKRKLAFQNRIMKRHFQEQEKKPDDEEILIPQILNKMRGLEKGSRNYSPGSSARSTPLNTPSTPTGTTSDYLTSPNTPRLSISPRTDTTLHYQRPISESKSSVTSETRSNSLSKSNVDPNLTEETTQDLPKKIKKPLKISTKISNSNQKFDFKPIYDESISELEQKQMDKLVGRLMKSLKHFPSTKEMATLVDENVEKIQQEFTSRGQEIPLVRIGDCSYQLGRRKLNLIMAGNQVAVKSGGGTQLLLPFLKRHLATARNI